MSKRKKAAIWVAALSIICGLIIWHAIHWHSTGMYLRMFNWRGTDRAYLVMLYNVGLILSLGALLGFLMSKITDLLGYEVSEVKRIRDKEKDSTGQ